MAAWNPMNTTTPMDYFRSLVASDAQFPLLEAAASLAHVQHPHTDVQAVLAQVDGWLVRLRRRNLFTRTSLMWPPRSALRVLRWSGRSRSLRLFVPSKPAQAGSEPRHSAPRGCELA